MNVFALTCSLCRGQRAEVQFSFEEVVCEVAHCCGANEREMEHVSKMQKPERNVVYIS